MRGIKKTTIARIGSSVILLAFAAGMTSFASTSSSGVIDVVNGSDTSQKVHIDASDITDNANATTNIQNQLSGVGSNALSYDAATKKFSIGGTVVGSPIDSSTAVPTAADILTGKSAWVNGVQINGTMPNNGATGSKITPDKSYTIPLGYTSGGTVSVDSSATATADNIYTGKTAWVNGNKVTGSMPDKSSITTFQNLAAGFSGKIPTGYYNGNTVVSTASLSSQTQADSTAADILTGKTAWVNGAKLTGSMPNSGALGAAGLLAGGSYTIPKGYTTGGTVTTASLSSQTQATSAATDILTGKTAWVNGTKVTGSMVNNGDQSATVTPDTKTHTIKSGYSSGGTITIDSSVPSATANEQAVNASGDKLYYADATAQSSHDLTKVTTTANAYPVTYVEAAANNLTAGSAAWVNGTLIKGTGADNDAFGSIYIPAISCACPTDEGISRSSILLNNIKKITIASISISGGNTIWQNASPFTVYGIKDNVNIILAEYKTGNYNSVSIDTSGFDSIQLSVSAYGSNASVVRNITGILIQSK